MKKEGKMDERGMKEEKMVGGYEGYIRKEGRRRKKEKGEGELDSQLEYKVRRKTKMRSCQTA